MYKSKIHRATITAADLNYEGSITIDTTLMEAANLRKYEAVWIWNINNGSRLMTYIIEGEKDSGVICLNGSAARLCQVGDKAIITAFADMTPLEADEFEPVTILVDDNNRIIQTLKGSGREITPNMLNINDILNQHSEIRFSQIFNYTKWIKTKIKNYLI